MWKEIYISNGRENSQKTAVSVQFFINTYVQLSIRGKKVEHIVYSLLEAITWSYSKSFSHPKQKWM